MREQGIIQCEQEGDRITVKNGLWPASGYFSAALIVTIVILLMISAAPHTKVLYPLFILSVIFLGLSVLIILPRLRSVILTPTHFTCRTTFQSTALPWSEITEFTVSSRRRYDPHFYVLVHTKEGMTHTLSPWRNTTAFETAFLLNKILHVIHNNPFITGYEIQKLIKEEHTNLSQELRRFENLKALMPHYNIFSRQSILNGISLIVIALILIIVHWNGTFDSIICLNTVLICLGITFCSYRRVLYYHRNTNTFLTNDSILLFDFNFAFLGKHLQYVELFRGLANQSEAQRLHPSQKYWSLSLINQQGIRLYYHSFTSARGAMKHAKTIANRFNLPLHIIDKPSPYDRFRDLWRLLVVILMILFIALCLLLLLYGAIFISSFVHELLEMLQNWQKKPEIYF